MKGNLLGPMYTINAFLPLIREGAEKKIIYITSGHADLAAIKTAGLPMQFGYSTSKAAGNIAVAKFAAELEPEGIYTLSLSPGWVATDAGELICMKPAITELED
jgi:NAD(P)-dependent dehydrogenase (short-subunit alcohol dehydrogenase family)